ncbi:hypothetical protein [Weissella halotolerans]|uniref:TPR repeat-containing protein n=1 Tax=Weissella halotolerans DSM 20190 TaxID=1123500 RepID=A0A0R2FYX4_9LACO|nr:hypothetical protein [Weissella halotolerans]KRN33673.1 TPR repeat-containing protein [Weissella halotolerans DSM 20190]
MKDDLAKLLTSGELNQQAGDLRAAIEDYKAAYALEQTLTINHQLVAALTLDQQYQQAYRYLQEALPSYLDQTQWWALVLEVMLKTHHFIDARLFIKHLPMTVNAQYRQQIERAETEAIKTEEKQIQSLTKTVYHLSDVSLPEQKKILAQAQTLPYASYLFVSKYILVDPFALPITRVTVLDELRQLGVEEVVPFQTVLGTQIMVQPSELLALSQERNYQAVQGLLTESEQNLDPGLATLLRGQVNLMLVLLYPCLTEAIQDPKSWVQQVQAFLLTGHELDLPESKEQIKWRKAALNALQELQDQ